MPLLAGLLPDVTVTLMVVVAPGSTLPGFVDAMPVGGAEAAVTVSAIDVEPLRLCASVIVTARFFTPADVPALTVAVKEKLFPPLSVNACVLEPPMELRSARTAMPVLVGLVPGVTLTV